MGNDTNRTSITKFIECEKGRQFLDGIRAHLKGHTIDQVDFINNGIGVTTILRLNNGQCYAFNDDELSLETLREQFSGLFRELTRHNKEKCYEQNAIRADRNRRHEAEEQAGIPAVSKYARQ